MSEAIRSAVSNLENIAELIGDNARVIAAAILSQDAAATFTESRRPLDEQAYMGIRAAMSMVQQFHDKNNVAQVKRLCSFDDPMAKLRDAAISLRTWSKILLDHVDDVRGLRAHLIIEETAELIQAMYTNDEDETLDALADLLYVVLGTAVSLDLPLGPAFVEVHESNMTKERQPDDPHGERVRSKGPNYRPPNLEQILYTYRRVRALPHSMTTDSGDCTNCGMSWKEVYEQIDTRPDGRAHCKGYKV
jgi:NTP pyrophosphatase (non-canonical NTP hydrolase)